MNASLELAIWKSVILVNGDEKFKLHDELTDEVDELQHDSRDLLYNNSSNACDSEVTRCHFKPWLGVRCLLHNCSSFSHKKYNICEVMGKKDKK